MLSFFYNNLGIRGKFTNSLITDKSPFYINEHFIIGYDKDNNFYDDNDNVIPIERMVKAVIIDDIKEEASEIDDLLDDDFDDEFEETADIKKISSPIKIDDDSPTDLDEEL